MVETVDTHCELPQAQLFDGRQLEDRWRKSLNDPVHDGQRNEFSPGTPPGMRATLVRPLDGRLRHNTLVLCVEHAAQALAFHRRGADRILAFSYSEARGVYDDETGSVWNEIGEAISGPLAGTQLEYLESGVGEWYEFAACHPGAEIFEATQRAKGSGEKSFRRIA